MGLLELGREALQMSIDVMRAFVRRTGGALGQAEPGKLSRRSTRQPYTRSASMRNRYGK